jgi:hypothetical protein
MIRTVNGPLTRVEKIGLAAAVLLALSLMWPLRHYVTDDTYIHLQYARHLAQGEGLVFNVGEHVYGCTSPLWVALIADAMALGIDGLLAARVLGLAATLASIALFLQLTRRTMRVPELRALATVAWAGHAWMIRWSLSGMETPLAVALVLGGFVAYTEGLMWGSRPLRTGALWSLAALTRPEAVLLLGFWGVFLLVDADSRNGVRRLAFGVIPPVVIYGGWMLFSKVYFGTFWPQTLNAKAAGASGMSFQLANLWRQVSIISATDGLLALMLVLALGFSGPRLFTRAPSQRLLPWAWTLGLPLLYAARGVPVVSRYLLPLLPVLAWLTWRTLERWWAGENLEPARVRRAIVFGWILATVVLAQNFTVYRTSVVPHVESFTHGMQTSLIPWGKWFRDHTPPTASIAAPDIGAIGYFSERRVVDLAGLVTPEMIPLLQHDLPENLVANLSYASFGRPEYLVDRATVENDMLARSPFASALTPLGHASVPNLGIARPGRAVYTFYRVEWSIYDSLRASRARAPMN